MRSDLPVWNWCAEANGYQLGRESMLTWGYHGGKRSRGTSETEEVKVGIALSRMQGEQGTVLQPFL